jgi:hypothetical protein
MNRKSIYFVITVAAMVITGCSPAEPPDAGKSESAPESSVSTSTGPIIVDQPDGQPSDTHKMVKAVHYFADAWPKTFWQEFEVSHIDADIQRIKEDGFNTVILAVPWMGFESNFEARKTRSDPRLYQRLELLLQKIGNAGLNYILRVGFPHDFTPDMDTDNVQLCLGMYAEEHTLEQWADYLKKLRQVTNRHSKALSGILLSWEDFWCVHFVFSYETEERRKWLAKKLHYDEWLKTQDPGVVKILMGENAIQFEQIAVPTKDEPSYYLFMKFINEKLSGHILQSTKAVFPEAAMEERVDKDPVPSHKGTIWIENDMFLDETNHRGTYWSPHWGAQNEGEQLTLEQALTNFEYFLRYVSADGAATNHVIDQFNFFDNTPYFSNNAQIEKSSIPEFLEGAAPLIKQFSAGYGLWAYHDYVDNVLYNASFELDLEGWAATGQVNVLHLAGENQLSMQRGSQISQVIDSTDGFMLSRTYVDLTLCFCSDSEGAAVISESGVTLQEIDVTAGQNCHEFDASPIKEKKEALFGFQALDDLVIDDLKLFGFVQKLGVYDEFGRPGEFLDGIRRLNGNLELPATPTRFTNQASTPHPGGRCLPSAMIEETRVVD